MGDDKLQRVYKRWKVVATGMVVPMDERIVRDIFLERIWPSKKQQPDINECERMREDDSRNNIRWLTDSIDRLLQRERMLSARSFANQAYTIGGVIRY